MPRLKVQNDWHATTGGLTLQLASCLIIYARALEYVISFWCLRSVSMVLASVKFAEDKVVTFFILREKCQKSATLTLT